jgi:hypothetical protein
MAEQYEKLVKDIADKLDALGQRVQPELIERLVKDKVTEALAQNPDFQRKMQFAPAGEGRGVEGTRWARLGMSDRDVMFMRDWQWATKKTPSEPLENFCKSQRQWHASQATYDGRAMDTAESGYGSQLVGVAYNGSLWDQALQETRVFGLLDRFQMKAPTEYLPVAAALPSVMLFAESTAHNSSNFTTTKTGSNRVTVTAKKLGMHEMWSGEMEEDAIIYNDAIVLNGDDTNAGTGNINEHDANPADTNYYLAWDGIRHVGLVDVTSNQKDAAGAITKAMLRNAQSRMLDRAYHLDWGHDFRNVFHIADPQTADAICDLADVVLWSQNQGEPLLTGQVARVLGIPVISSIALKLTAADGCVDAADDGTKGQVVTFNRNGFVVGWLRGVKMEFERIPATDQSRMVYTWRIGFGRYSPTGAVSGIECADVIYDITLPS